MPQRLGALARFAAGSGGLLIALAAVLILAPGKIPWLSQLDAVLFPAAVQLLPDNSAGEEVGVVRLPVRPGSTNERQLAAMDRLAAILPDIRQTVVWIDSAPLRDAAAWTVEGQRLRRALATAIPPVTLHTDDAASTRWQVQLPLVTARPPMAEIDRDQPPWSVSVPLVHRTADGLSPTPLLGGYQRSRNLGLQWSAWHGLRLPTGAQLTGPDGRIYPHSLVRGRQPREFGLDALPFASLPSVLLIGANGDPALDVAAATLQSMLDTAYSYSPWWSMPLDKVLVVLLLIHFLVVMPRIGAGTGFLLTLLAGLAVLTVQFGLQLTRSEWASFAGSYGMLLAGYPLAALGAYAARDRRRLQSIADRARLELARHQIRQGELDPARKQLLETAASRERLELLYDLAIAYERRRQYANACEAFAACMRQDKAFRDVKDRLAVLAQVGGVAAGPTLSSAATLVMPQAVEKPVLGRYRLERELGRGAMGVVYLGVDPKISRNVAIKTMDMAQLPADEVQEFKARFFREAEAAGRLSHPSIVTVYDVGEEGDLAFIAMDYASGRPLSDYVDNQRLLPIAQVYSLIAEVAEALDYAHSKGVVHRDIKPANLIYDPEQDSIKITDFGIARVGDTRRTSTGTVLGSPSYMAPEQFAGSNVQGTADIFSLGVTFYQLLSGKLPFSGENVAQLAYRISQANYTDVRKLRRELPASASRIIAKALAKAPADRYQRGSDMAEALRRGMPKRKAS